MTITVAHQPGQPYLLSREQFVQFAGIAGTVAAFRAALEAHAAQRGRTDARVETRAFWAAIAAFEAAREFNPLADGCFSKVSMETHDGNRASLMWSYTTTSGTILEAIEPRECVKVSEPGYPGWACGDLPDPVFRVTIPADRDRPGRYHYEQLRRGGSYCE